MILDYDDAYTNGAYITGGAEYPARWQAAAEHYRDVMLQTGRAQIDISYGDHDRHKFDLFLPEGEAKGLCIFVHGGYWMRFDKSYWSHLATGAVIRGWAVAMPSYPLTPDVTIGNITASIARAITAIATYVDGPIHLAGHSAGGHLVSRMVVEPSQVPEAVRNRIEHVISISGLNDLRPLLRTAMNETFKLTELEARNESPALRRPKLGTSVMCWVGANERPEFIRQNDLLANIWAGLGAEMASLHAEGRHHFNVIDDLLDPDSEMCALFAP